MKNILEIDARTDDEVLLPTEAIIRTSIGEYNVKEWTLNDFKPIKEDILNFFHKIMKQGIDPTIIFFRPAAAEYFEKILMAELDDQLPELSGEQYDRIKKAYEKEENDLREISLIAIDYAVPIIAHTLDEEEEKVGSLAMQELMALFFTLLDFNGGYLKNSLGLFGRVYRNFRTTEESKPEAPKKKSK